MPTRDIRDAHHLLARRYAALKAEYEAEYPNRRLELTCVYRPIDEQAVEYAKGRTIPGPGATPERPLGHTVTRCDGLHRKSRHNYAPSEAVDVVVKIRLTSESPWRVTWDPEYYKPLARLAIKHNLVSLGPTMGDWPHLELPKGNR